MPGGVGGAASGLLKAEKTMHLAKTPQENAKAKKEYKKKLKKLMNMRTKK